MPLIVTMFQAFDALRRNGWQEPCYAPPNADLEYIEAGSTGIHYGHKDENGDIWDAEGGRVRPILCRRPLA